MHRKRTMFAALCLALLPSCAWAWDSNVRIPRASMSSVVKGEVVWHNGTRFETLAVPGAERYMKIVADGTLSWATIAGGGDVVGPGSSDDNSIVRFDGATGKVLQNTGTVTLGDAGKLLIQDTVSSGAGNLILSLEPQSALAANAEWTGVRILGDNLDPSGADTRIRGLAVDLSGVDLTNLPELDGIRITMPNGEEHALHIAQGQLHQHYETGSDAGAEYTIQDIVVDVGNLAATSDVHAMDIALTGTLAGSVAAVGTHTGVAPIHQYVGAFVSPGANYACRETAGPTFTDNIDGQNLFVAVNDSIHIGAAATFDEIALVFTLAATKDAFLEFYYWSSAGGPGYVEFFPADDTGGTTQDGTIRFNAANIPNWASGDPCGATGDAGYWIQVKRTRANDPGTITLATAEILAATEYGWDKDGNLQILAVTSGAWTATDVALAHGGTGASLADPGADRIGFWDDSATAFTWLTAGAGLTITDTTIAASGVGDMLEADWDGGANTFIDADAGGTDLDTSGSTGVPSITAGTWSVDARVTHEFGGLEADVAAYAGLVQISGGVTSAVPITGAGAATLSLADPNADRAMFWDDSETTMAWLTFSTTDFTVVGTTLSATVSSLDASDGAPLGLVDVDASGVVKISGYNPTGHDSSTSALIVDPVSASADAALLWLGVNTSERFQVDEDGDVVLAGNKTVTFTGGTIHSGIDSSYLLIRGCNGSGASLLVRARKSSSADAFTLSGGSRGDDSTAKPSYICGQEPLAAAAVNQDGGDVIVSAGDHATGGGTEGAVRITQADQTTDIIDAYQGADGLGVVELTAVLMIHERSSDPAEPAEGECIVWMSDGTGKGDDGDVMIASKAGGTTNYGTLFDHSAGAAW